MGFYDLLCIYVWIIRRDKMQEVVRVFGYDVAQYATFLYVARERLSQLGYEHVCKGYLA